MRLLLLPLLLLLAPRALAHPSHGEDEYYPPTTPKAAPPSLTIPATYPEVVIALRERLTATQAALDAGKIMDLHTTCTNLKDLSAALPGKATGLSADAQVTVGTTTTHLQSKVAEIVTAADKADVTGAKAAIAAASTDIDVLTGLVKK